jgi:hypothetical protein
MITLSSIMDQFEADFLSAFQGQVLPNQIKALGNENLPQPCDAGQLH